ncbi:hypothetical protein FRAHR75_50064 [Frankia sp. Hr75.2]|nr:hypothetical protein FRAHR75_50064 [Frankia sp. Hr75.2]
MVRRPAAPDASLSLAPYRSPSGIGLHNGADLAAAGGCRGGVRRAGCRHTRWSRRGASGRAVPGMG